MMALIWVLLPQKLSLIIYAFAFSVDTDLLKTLGAARDYVQKHELPPLRTCKKLESYVTHRKVELERLPGVWPDDVESAFFIGIESTICTFTQTLTQLELLTGRAKSMLTQLLCAHGIQLTQKRKRDEVISDIILGFTGQFRSRRQVSSHRHTLKHVLRIPLQATFSNGRDWISDIVSFTQCEPLTMHDSIYHLLHHRVLEIDNELGTFESLIFKALNPAYRSAIRRLFISICVDDLRRITEILVHDNFPCLKRVTVRINHLSAVVSKEDFTKVLKTANPKAEVKVFTDTDDSHVTSSELCNRNAYKEVVQELKQRRLGGSVVSAVSGLDIDSEGEETGLRGEEEILRWICGVRSKDEED